jgi:methionine-rich copper-binding protein CopC
VRMCALLGFTTLSALGLFLAPAAQANNVVATVPAIGAVLSQAPNAVSVTAASSLLPDGNSLAVTDPNGAQVDDGSLTIADTSALVGLKPLKITGIYTVSYMLLSSTDTPLTGSYTFLFNAPASVTSPSNGPAPTATAIAGGTKNANSSSANVAIWVFLGLATIVALRQNDLGAISKRT